MQRLPSFSSGWCWGSSIVAVAAVVTQHAVGMRLGIEPLFLPMAKALGLHHSPLAFSVAVVLGRMADQADRKHMQVMIYVVHGLGFWGLSVSANELELIGTTSI